MNYKYAPIYIPTLCRYEHFKECIESLARNSLAKETVVYVPLDYPLKEEHWDGYNKIKVYLTKIDGYFAQLHVIERKENFGAVKNEREAKKYIFNYYDRCILSEDDNVFAPNFLEYMNKGLEKYSDDSNAMAICGYTRPIDWIHSDNNHFRLGSFSAWGFGIWRDKYEEFMRAYNLKWFYSELFSKKKVFKVLRKSPLCFNYIIEHLYTQEMDLFDCGFMTYVLLCDKYSIYAMKSKVINKGFDGSGINMHVDTLGYTKTKLDRELHFDFLGNDNVGYIENEQLLRKFYTQSIKRILKNIVKMFIVLFRGKKVFK